MISVCLEFNDKVSANVLAMYNHLLPLLSIILTPVLILISLILKIIALVVCSNTGILVVIQYNSEVVGVVVDVTPVFGGVIPVKLMAILCY